MAEPSGVAWCARFPGSASPDDLTRDFRDRVLAFISQIKDGGGSVSIAATYRPPQRAYLMHWCCMVAGSGQDPAKVPKMAGVDIAWMHTKNGAPDIGASRAAAAAMQTKYAIKFPAALVSRHTQRRAIDMAIRWSGTLSVRDFNGRLHKISDAPHSGSNAELIAVGKTFGVIKLVKDPPHWSDDGH